MPFPLFQVDAFTDRVFAGNPAAVCLLPHPADPLWMQLVAREMNLSETAFLAPWDDADESSFMETASAQPLLVAREMNLSETAFLASISGEATSRLESCLESRLDSSAQSAPPASGEASVVGKSAPFVSGKTTPSAAGAAVPPASGKASSGFSGAAAASVSGATAPPAFTEAAPPQAWSLRWFTPAAEVPLCGHATLASAHVLWQAGYLAPAAPARFHTRSGWLSATRRGEWIELDFPALAVAPAEPPAGLLAALAGAASSPPISPLFVGSYNNDYLIELSSVSQLRALAPDHPRLRRLPLRAVIVTARAAADVSVNAAANASVNVATVADPAAAAGCDFVSRFFAPGVGIDEDPVTGSAHCALAPYWAAKLSKSALSAFQASPRGGRLRLELSGNRVKLSGQAVTILRGELLA